VNLSQTAELLTAIASYDRRKLGEADVVAWQKLMVDVDLADGLEAVERYYAEQTDWMMPAHVRRLVRDIVNEREAEARATGWAPGQAGVPKDQAMPEIEGTPGWFADAVQKVAASSAKEILAELRQRLPEGSREALMPRTVAWEKEHRAYLRVRDSEPNPHYKPTQQWCNSACRPESSCDSPRHWWQSEN